MTTSLLTKPWLRSHFRALPALAILFLFFLAVCIIWPTAITSQNPIKLNMIARLQPPSFEHIFGTDEAGRDLFSRLVHGTRYSLGVALAVVASAAIFGVIYGAIAGFASPRVDTLMMRIVDVFMGFPSLIFALAVAAALGRGLGSVTLALSLMWWPGFARTVRAEVVRLKEFPHIEAARALGVKPVLIFVRHIMPFVAGPVNIRITTDIGYALVAVTALSFLGLGAKSPTPEWGLLIRDARPYFGSAWWYLVFPGVAIMLCAAAFSILGDTLTDRRRK
ncbi:ABC transporter permease [Ochrobactrum sp. CM-21-5]|nr:ABC transporter permease [Ochrobactrum sp. CM-21-5]MBC2887431.1 ABC transporter permease [Ochrobactrum sp. CM-21-5]